MSENSETPARVDVTVRSAPLDPADRFTVADLLAALESHAREQQQRRADRQDSYGRVAELTASLRAELATLDEPRLS